MDEETVIKIARLSRLKVTPEEVKTRTKDIGGILKWVEQLAEVNTDGIAPLANVVDTISELRADEVTDGGYSDKVLANAPEMTEGFYVVPKVIEDAE